MNVIAQGWPKFRATSNTGSPPIGGIDLVSSVSGASATSFATSSIDTTGADLLVVNMTGLTNLNSFSISDSKSNSWTLLTERMGGDISTQLAWCSPSSVGTGHTFTFSFIGASFGSLQVGAFSGTNASPFETETGSGTSGASSLQPGSIAPSQGGELFISGNVQRETDGNGVSCDMPILQQNPFAGGNNFAGAMAYLIQPSTASVNPVWSWSGSYAAAAAMASFKPA